MLGSNPGFVPQPAEVLVPHLEARGHHCYLTSAFVNKYKRFADSMATVIRLKSVTDVLSVQVYSGQGFILSDLVSWLGRRFGLGIVMALHGGALPQFIKQYPKWSLRVLRRAHLLVTPSGYLAQALKPYGLQARVIPNAIDLAEYPFSLRRHLRPRLLWMRTFHPVYNPTLAVEVISRLRAACDNATLTMAGQDEGLLQATKQYVQDIGIQECVQFAGYLDLEGKRQAFHTHDIYLNTNRVDNMPVSVIEAAAFGTPIVSTNVGGIPFLLTDGQDALLVPDDDPDSMTEAILGLLNHPGLAEQLSKNARELAEKHDFQSVARQWETAFNEVVAKLHRD
ncbi:MAG: glycosyltransferase family 4 protein [Anaerolineales bacterium]|nr:glycosyltransferase family 4 protein [Anaerolineales bacterium]